METGASTIPESPIAIIRILEQLAGGPLSVEHVVWFITGAVLIFVGIYSLLLLYHWIRYSFASFPTWIAFALYFGVLGLLLVAMFAAALRIVSP